MRKTLTNKQSELESIIDELYETSIISFEANQSPRKEIHVSDLTSECMRKTWYRILNYTPDKKDFKKALPLVHGTMLHSAVNLGGPEHELSMSGNIFKMKPVIPSDSLFECVYGSMDDLVEIDDELIICDKKTTKKSIPREVPDNYKIQMNIYKLLYYIKTGVSISKAAIIYIDKSTGWERHKTLVFDLDEIESTKQFIIERLNIISSKSVPPKVITYLCPWCPFYLTCKP